MTLLTLLKPKTDRAIDPAEAIARRLGMPQIAPYYVHELRTNPPGPDGGDYLVQLVNKDTGLVALATHEDPAEAFRQLAERFADDLWGRRQLCPLAGGRPSSPKPVGRRSASSVLGCASSPSRP
jgi:hypothetical protein